MQLPAKRTFLFAMGIFLLQSLTAQQNQAFKHIPEGCTQVMQLDMASMQQFMKWEEFNRLSFFNELKQRAGTDKEQKALAEVLLNPEETGIDLNQQLYVFSKRFYEDGEFEYYNGVTGKIGNLQKFTAWALKMNHTIALTQPGRVKTIVNRKSGYIWDTEHFAIVSDPMNETQKAFQLLQKEKIPANEPVFNLIARTFTEGAPAKATDPRMVALFQQNAPLKVWNMNAKHGAAGAITDPSKIFSALVNAKGTVSASTLNFENGRALFSSRTWFGENLDKIFSGAKTPFNSNLLKHVQPGKIPAFLTLKLNPARVKEFVEMVPGNWKTEFNLNKSGISAADLEAAFKGDLLVALLRTGDKENLLHPGLIAAFTINDVAACTRVLDSLKPRLSESEKRRIFFAVDLPNKIFVIGSSQQEVDAFVQGNYPEQEEDLLNQVTGNPFFLNINFATLYQQLLQIEKPKTEKDMRFAAVLESMEHLRATAGKYENGTMLLNYELGFMNKEDNGLRQMVLMYDKLLTGIMMNAPKMAEGSDTATTYQSITIEGEKTITPPPMELPDELVPAAPKEARPAAKYSGKGPGNSRTRKTPAGKNKKQ